MQYQAGVTYSVPFNVFKNSGVFIEAGFMGNSTAHKQFLPVNTHEAGGFGGVGVHF